MATIKKRGNSYLIRVSMGYDSNGKHIELSKTWKPDPGMTEKQIEKELNKQTVFFEEKCKTGLFLDSSTSFAKFIEIWNKDYAQKNLKAKTLAGYNAYLKRIIPALGHIKLSKLQPVHLIKFYDNLAKDDIRFDTKYCCKVDLSAMLISQGFTRDKFSVLANMSSTTLRTACNYKNISSTSATNISKALNCKISTLFTKNTDKANLSNKVILHHHRLISTILQTAVEWQVIPSNPCTRVKPPKVESKESRYLEDYEVIKLFQYLENESLQYKTIITLFMYSGMRRGELCGLKWSDINFPKKLVNIEREILYLPGRGLFEETTKTEGSRRVIKIADISLQLLQKYKTLQTETRLKVGDQWQDNNYIFTQWNGNPIHPDSLTSWFSRFIKKCDLPYVTIHSLRHTNASLLIANGVNLTTIAKRLGHSNTATTTKIYAHAIKSADEQAVDVLQDILKR